MIENNEEGQGVSLALEKQFGNDELRHTKNKGAGVSAGATARGPRGGSRRAIALSVGNHGRVVEAREETEPHPRDSTPRGLYSVPQKV